METSIQCLYCNKVFDSKITIMLTLDQMKKHLKDIHPNKSQF